MNTKRLHICSFQTERRRVGFAKKLVSALLFALAAGLAMLPASAQAWWNDDWSLRKKITVDTSSSGANVTDQIGSLPVLIRLHVGNFKFSQAKEDASDLRFVADDDKTPLKYHIDKFDSLLGEALVWVRLQDLKPGAKTDIWLYYGNKKAVAANDAKGTYDSDTQLVYHFNERGTPALDSSVWANGSQNVGKPTTGTIIGNGLKLDAQQPLTLPASPSLALADGAQMTWSAWVKPDILQRNAGLYSRRDGANALVIGLDDGAPFVEVTNAGAVQRSTTTVPVAPGGWHRIAMSATPGLITLYLDGNPYATLNATLPALNAIASIGGDAAVAAPPSAPATAPSASEAAPSSSDAPSSPTVPPAGDGAAAPAAAPDATAAPDVAAAPAATVSGFAGDMDELEIDKIARPAGFIKAQSIGQGPDHAKLISFSVDEETASWFNGYFAVILKSVTIDGWVIIGILAIMAVISWLVMYDKVRYLNRQLRANAKFQANFREVAADLTALDHGDAQSVSSLGGRLNGSDDVTMKNSSLYRIYHIGATEIRHRFKAGDQGKVRSLSAASIAAIRAALDGGYVRENQSLNRLMVLLTIAISGGPFLGLLGTVVGVMITFAAIAQSGDVNVNAIAPGIAAALVATVAGLGVAIPALFGYNYLISQIKDLSSDMQVFIDEFTTKMAEAYDGTAVSSSSIAAE
jgi:biopolymer transport protein ExbB